MRRRSYGRDYGLGQRESEVTLEDGSSKYIRLQCLWLLQHGHRRIVSGLQEHMIIENAV